MLLDPGLELLPALDLLAVDRRDPVAGLQVGARGGRPCDDAVDRRGGAARSRSWPEPAAATKNNSQREQEVDGDAREDHDEPVLGAARPERAGLVGGVDLLHGVHPDDAHVAAERERLRAVLGLATAERPQTRPEAEEELGGLHPRALGGEEVPELVEHHEEDDADDDDQRRATPGHEHREGDQAREEEQQDPGRGLAVDLGAGFFEGILHTVAPVRRSRASVAWRRATRSASRTSATS